MKKHKILWVEDDKDWCDRMQLIFGRKYDIVFVKNNENALAKLKEKHQEISMVVVDLHLEKKMDGVEMIKGVKSNFSALPIVVVTNGTMSEGMMARDQGADVVLSKDEINAEGWNRHL